jgi:tetratricopeptide (TPR) repeat protein
MVHYLSQLRVMSNADNPIQNEPPSEQELFARAEQLLSLGRTADALTLLEQLADALVDQPQLYYLRALATQQAGGIVSAFVDVRTALALGRRQGIDLHALQSLSDALKSSLPEEIPLLSVSRATANLRRLIAADKQRAAEEIADSLAPHLGSYRPLLLLADGLCRLSRGRPDQAIAPLEAAVSALPSLWPAAYACGHALLSIGDREGARRAFLHTAEQRQQHPGGFIYSEAEDLLACVPGMAFSSRSFAFERASLLHVLGHSDMALQVLAELIAEEPEASDAHLSQAVLLYQLGRLDDALSALARAEATLRPADRQSEPEDPLRRIELLRLQVLHGLGRHDEANALAAKLLPPDDTDPR